MTALLVTLLLAQAPDESAGEQPPKSDVISLELDSWMFAGMQMPRSSTALTFEHALAPQLSIAGGLVAEDYEEMTGLPYDAAPKDVQRWRGGIRALARWYPQGRAPLGLWLGVMASAGASRSEFALKDAAPFPSALFDLRVFTSAALIGFSGVLALDVVLQVSGGVRADFGTVTNAGVYNAGIAHMSWGAVSPVAHLGLGWVF